MMFDQLPNYLSRSWFSPAVFLCGFLVTVIFTPFIIRLAGKFGAVDTGGHRKKHNIPTPLLGGLAVLGPLLIICGGLAVLAPLTLRYWPLFARMGRGVLNTLMDFSQERSSLVPNLVVLMIGAMATAALGLLDDTRGIKSRVKLLGQVLIALFICSTGRYLGRFYIPFFGGIELSPVWGVIVSVGWIVGLMNAFNLVDGVDGLATGVGMITAAALAILGALNGDPFMVLVCSGVSGILLGFLIYNFHPAKIFLGDTGSMLIGFLLATITLLGTYKSETAFILVAPILALSLPLFEAGVSILRRFIRGVPIFSADSYHTHHRLLHRGISESSTALILYLVTALLSVSAILNNIIPEKTRWAWIPPFLYFGTLLWLTWWAGYLRPQAVGRIFTRRQRNTVLTALARYTAQTIASPRPGVSLQEIFDLCRREIKLDCLEAWLKDSGTIICSSRSPGYRGDGEIMMKISPPSGKTILVRYTFRQGLTEEEQIDAIAGLAGIFEQLDTASLYRLLHE